MRISDWSSDVCSSDLGRNLRALFRGVRAQAVETAPCVGLDTHLGAFAGNRGHKVGIEHGELGWLELDDDGIVSRRDHLAVEGLGIDGAALDRKSTRLNSSH